MVCLSLSESKDGKTTIIVEDLAGSDFEVDRVAAAAWGTIKNSGDLQCYTYCKRDLRLPGLQVLGPKQRVGRCQSRSSTRLSVASSWSVEIKPNW